MNEYFVKFGEMKIYYDIFVVYENDIKLIGDFLFIIEEVK